MWRALFLSVLTIAVCGSAGAQTPCADGANATVATVASVLDGETLQLHDGTELRLSGILAPRAADVPRSRDLAWPSQIAARAELEALLLGRDIRIGATGETLDRYGRKLGQAYLVAAPQAGPVWVQGHLLAQGLVRAHIAASDAACRDALLAAEATARTAARGVWSEAAYAVRDAADADALLALRGSYQLVEGTVTRAQTTRSTHQLWFARDSRKFGLLASVPRRRLQEAPQAGARVRLRGWVEETGLGPKLDLASFGEIEMLEQPDRVRGQATRRRRDAP